MWLLAAQTSGALFVARSLRGRANSKRGGAPTAPTDPDVVTATGGGRLVTPVLLLASLGVAMAQTIVVSALPVFARELGVPAADATWLLTVFMLAAGIATPIAGRLGDGYGYRVVLTACLACLVVGSVVAGIADRCDWFAGVVAGRVLQGFSGGAFPAAFGLARLAVPPGRLSGVVAALSSMFGVGGALGMVVAGPLADAFGTSSLFWLTSVIAVLALVGTVAQPRDHAKRPAAETLDLGGAILLSGALVALLLAISQGRSWGWASVPTLGLLMAAGVFGICFVSAELASTEPLLDLRLIGSRALAATNIATVVISVGMFAAVTLIPQFVQTPPRAGYGFGATAGETGLFMVPMAACMLISAPLTARISARTSGRTTFLLGALLACAALAALGVFHQQPWHFYTAGAVLGTAYGFAFASLGNLVVGAVRADRTGVATGINTVLRTIGGAVGAQLAVVVVAASAGRTGLPAASGYTAAFAASAAIVALAALATAAIPSGQR
ncbi:MFS transporter [Nocardia carnea]|uniref:MFS transporter n=1 Tax=Nocardia carnea TaxID=37328 RepID=UPI0024580BDD|nr:MFS transporter [Nocardia carnea]